MAYVDEDTHMWGEGAKQAGYIRAMVAKDMGKTRKDYDPVRRKKRIGRFDINKMSNPSDNLKLVYMDKHKAKPAKTWEQVKAEASDIKHAVATWVRMNPNKSERDIARDTGVSQPSINRWKRLTGGAEDNLSPEEVANRSELRTFPQTKAQLQRSLGKLEAESTKDRQTALELASEVPEDSKIKELVEALMEWSKERARVYRFILSRHQNAYDEYTVNQYEDREDDADPDSGVPEHEEWLSDLQGAKETYMKVLIIIKQIKRAIVRQLLHVRKDEPTAPTPVRLKKDILPNMTADTPIMNAVYSDEPPVPDVEHIQEEDEDEPTSGGNRKPNSGYKFAQEYERRSARGGNATPNSGYYFAQEYERRPVRGGAKPMMRLYRPNGKLFKGNYHIMPDGKVHSGIKHTKSSQLLIIK
jgi:hypothetical protein